MSKLIHKYCLQFTFLEKQVVEMHAGAELMEFQNQKGVPVLWVREDPSQGKVKRTFSLIPTGAAAPDLRLYVGTAQFEGGDLVLHLFAQGWEPCSPST